MSGTTEAEDPLQEEWIYDDADIPDFENLLRRIPNKPDFRSFDAECGCWRPGPSAFRRSQAGEGMSVHRESILIAHKRNTCELYPVGCCSVSFHVSIVRSCEAGVVATLPTNQDENDADLRVAHAEVRPPTYEVDKKYWSNLRNQIIRAAVWVATPPDEDR